MDLRELGYGAEKMEMGDMNVAVPPANVGSADYPSVACCPSMGLHCCRKEGG